MPKGLDVSCGHSEKIGALRRLYNAIIIFNTIEHVKHPLFTLRAAHATPTRSDRTRLGAFYATLFEVGLESLPTVILCNIVATWQEFGTILSERLSTNFVAGWHIEIR